MSNGTAQIPIDTMARRIAMCHEDGYDSWPLTQLKAECDLRLIEWNDGEGADQLCDKLWQYDERFEDDHPDEFDAAFENFSNELSGGAREGVTPVLDGLSEEELAEEARLMYEEELRELPNVAMRRLCQSRGIAVGPGWTRRTMVNALLSYDAAQQQNRGTEPIGHQSPRVRVVNHPVQASNAQTISNRPLYEGQTRARLFELCEERNINTVTRDTKARLVDFLVRYDEARAARQRQIFDDSLGGRRRLFEVDLADLEARMVAGMSDEERERTEEAVAEHGVTFDLRGTQTGRMSSAVENMAGAMRRARAAVGTVGSSFADVTRAARGFEDIQRALREGSFTVPEGTPFGVEALAEASRRLAGEAAAESVPDRVDASWLMRQVDPAATPATIKEHRDSDGEVIAREEVGGNTPTPIMEARYQRGKGITNDYEVWHLIMYSARHGYGVKGGLSVHKPTGKVRSYKEREWCSGYQDRLSAEFKFQEACGWVELREFKRVKIDDYGEAYTEETRISLDRNAVDGSLYVATEGDGGRLYLPVTYSVTSLRFDGVNKCRFNVWLSPEAQSLQRVLRFSDIVMSALKLGGRRAVVDVAGEGCVEVYVETVRSPFSEDKGFLIRKGMGIGSFETVVLQTAKDMDSLVELGRGQVLRRVMHKKTRRVLEL